MAFASTGKMADARAEVATLTKSQDGVNKAADASGVANLSRIGRIMHAMLDAKIADAGGDHRTAITFLREAVAEEDNLDYQEPPDWWSPARETLGAVLLVSNKPAEAEQVFRDDLKHNANNPRSIFGLWKALDAQDKKADAQAEQQKFDTAWKNADGKLRLSDL
jgi:hypothetical protein